MFLFSLYLSLSLSPLNTKEVGLPGVQEHFYRNISKVEPPLVDLSYVSQIPEHS